MKNKLKENIIEFMIVVLIASTLFSSIGINYRSYDTYRIEMTQGLENYSLENSFNDGRIFMGAICLSAAKNNIDVQSLVTVDYILAILIIGCSIIYLKNILIKITGKENLKIIYLILSFLFFFNFMVIDSMQWIENVVMAVSILLYTIAAKKLVVDQKKVTSLLLVLLGMFFYQATICCFLQLVMFFELITNKKFKNILYSWGISLIAIAGNYAYIKIYESIFKYDLRRINTNIFSNIANLFKNMDTILVRSAGLLYDYVWILFILVILIILFLVIYKNKKNYKNMINIGIISVYSIIVPLSTMIVSDMLIYGSGRIFFSIGSLIPLLFIYILITMNLDKEKILRYIFFTIVLIYFIVNIINIYQICYSLKKANEFDKEICDTIVNSIEKYERENNKTVKGIATKYSPTGTKGWKIFEELRPIGVTKSYVLCGLPIRTLIKLYTDREFDNIYYEDEEFDKYFEGKELDKEFSEKHIEIVNDVAYVYF